MKRYFVGLFLWVVALCSVTHAQLNNSTRVVTVVKDDYLQLQLYFEPGSFVSSECIVQNTAFTILGIDGFIPSAEVGAPMLPIFSNLIEVPLCGSFSVDVSGAVYDTVPLRGSLLMPTQPSRSKSDTVNHPLVVNERIYAANEFYGLPLVQVEAIGIARDRNLARLQFSPIRYNPVTGTLIVCRKATVTVHYVDARIEETEQLFARHHSPAFASGSMCLNNLHKSVRTSAPVRYLIVAHSSFRGQLDSFVQWKRRKGFITDIVYTDDPGVGTTNTAIAAYVKSQYDNATVANPAPTYLLIVGDHEQIPAFAAQVSSPSSDHITDLYYISWTSGDIIPDCYCGRFSAQSVDQLTPQIEKTLMYEQYGFSDPSFLDRAVMVAGVDGGSSGDYGYTHADPAMDYAITNYVNGSHGFSQVMYFKNNTSIVPSGSNVTVGSSSSSNSATVRNYYNEGAGWINYSAHGSATSWGTPNFTTSHAASMSNTQKFGIMIGNCCLTNKFETTTCIGESVLRKGNYCGAVGYIGGSNSTYWNEDFYWAVGLRSGISATMSMAYNSSNLGGYDRIFHTHGEAQSDWVKTQGELMFQGNMAVQSSTSSYKNYYWEIYHLMGDPSLMPYLTQAPAMPVSVSPVLMVGTNTLSVTAAPYAYVALTDTLTHSLKACGFADASGNVTLSLPSALPVGGYELAASAQQYQTAFRNISVIPSAGAYPVVVSVSPTTSLNAGSSVPLRIAVTNIGNSNATEVSLSLASDNPLVTLSTSSVSVGSIPVGDTVTITSVSVTASSQAADGTQAVVTTNTGCSQLSTTNMQQTTLTVNAPAVTMTVATPATNLLPGTNMTVTVILSNRGHAALGSTQLSVSTGNPLMTANPNQQSIQQLDISATSQVTFQLNAAATIDSNIFVPIYLHLDGATTIDDTLQIYIGINSTETFEGGQYQVHGWSQGQYPWTLTNEESYEGSWSARSAESLGHNNTSEMSISFNAATADSVIFFYRVSSEANYDKFHCYIDGVEMVVASGEVAWTRAAFAVSAGSHQLMFSYSKDVSIDRNSDCAWVDYINLPHGIQTGDDGGGDGDEEGTFENFSATFESPADDSLWTLVNGNLGNVWSFGNSASNGGSRALYISNNGGQTNEYTITSSSSVFAYSTLWFDTGDYVVLFDWRCNGESSYDYLRAALVPNNIAVSASSSLPSGWSTSTIPSGSIAIDGGQKLNLSASWQTQTSEISVSQRGWYNLVFFWRNDNSVGSMPPAAIDNVLVLRASGIHTVTVMADHGLTTGSGNYQTGEVATIGVYPEAGYTFVGWNDGNGDNPRQLAVDGDRTITATLSHSNIITIHDTTILHDTASVTVFDTVTTTQIVYDTTSVTLHDTTSVTLYDTVITQQTVYDTTAVTLYDTVITQQTVYDTTAVTLYDTVITQQTVYDTTSVTLYDTVITQQTVYDTTAVTLFDTVITMQTVYDTTAVTLYDTVITQQTVYDTTAVTLYDTVITQQTVYDTTAVTLYDTVITQQTVYDTPAVTLFDTVIIQQTVFDTVSVTVYDTLTTTLTFFDTVSITIYDTVISEIPDIVYIYDTIVTCDTIYLYEYIYDTVFIHDTVFINNEDIDEMETVNVRIYQQNGQLVVEGAEGNIVYLYDVLGRVLATKKDYYRVVRFDVPASGTYLIKVGNLVARRVVVIK